MSTTRSPRFITLPLLILVLLGSTGANAAPLPFDTTIIKDGGCSSAGLTTTTSGHIDQQAREHVIWWGWETYHATSACSNELQAVLGVSNSQQLGIGGTRWLNTIKQYADPDYEIGATSNANSEPGMQIDTFNSEDMSGVPAPVQGSFTPAQISAIIAPFAEYISNYYETTTADDIYTVIMPPNTAIGAAGFNNNIDGYLFNVIGFPGGCPTNVSAYAAAQRALAHELAEISTDANANSSGWENSGNNGCQVADLCYNFQFQVQPEPYFNNPYGNILNGQGILVYTQPEWSNEAQDCVYGRTENAFGVMVGTDDNLYITPYVCNTPGTGISAVSWYGLGNDGYPLVGKAAVTSSGPERLDAFVMDASSTIRHLWSDNDGYSYGWEGLTASNAGYAFFSTQLRDQPDAARGQRIRQ